MPYKLGLINLNGTLIDDVPLILASSQHVFHRFAPDIIPPSLDDFRSGTTPLSDAEWHYRRGIPRTIPHEEIKGVWMRYYESNSGNICLSDGALRFLSFMRGCEVRIIIISEAPRSMKQLVEKLGIINLVDRICFNATDKTSVISHLLTSEAYRGIQPRKVFFMSDTVNDIVQGNAANVATFAYVHGLHPLPALKNARPKRIVHSFRDAVNEVRAQIPEYA